MINPAFAILGSSSLLLPMAPRAMPMIEPTTGITPNNPSSPKMSATIPFVLLLLGR